MRPAGVPVGFWRAVPSSMLLFCLAASGCNNTCVFFTSNPATGKIEIVVNNARRTCTLSRANGIVRVQVGGSPSLGPNSIASSIQHIFVSLRGIEAHLSAVADEDSPDWQELAPQLARHPVQVDLMEPAAASCGSSPFGEGLVPGGEYRQIRLRLTANHPASGAPAPEKNQCGGVGFNCVVTGDGKVRPVVLDRASAELHLGPEQIAGGLLRVLPDTHTDVAIQFHLHLSSVLPAGDALRLVPVLTAAKRDACESLEGSERSPTWTGPRVARTVPACTTTRNSSG